LEALKPELFRRGFPGSFQRWALDFGSACPSMFRFRVVLSADINTDKYLLSGTSHQWLQPNQLEVDQGLSVEKAF